MNVKSDKILSTLVNTHYIWRKFLCKVLKLFAKCILKVKIDHYFSDFLIIQFEWMLKISTL